MTDGTGAMTAEFDKRYLVIGAPVMRRVELRVIGSDYGATSYTTRTEADRLGGLLGLSPGSVLLDIGSGAGWPGLYLAGSTGCRVVLTDLPLEGLRAASRRITDDGVTGGSVMAASGALLPLSDHSFDAVTSSDALC